MSIKKCSVCGNEGEFRSYGVPQRPEAQCPYCFSLERHRLLWIFLAMQTDLFKVPNRLLHFAPEGIFNAIFTGFEGIDYFPVDIVPEDYSEMEGSDIKKADITDIPFEDESFDVILANHVLEHIEDDHLAMSELYRVLRSGGWAVLQVPIDTSRAVTLEDPSIVTDEDRLHYYGQKEHVRLYGRDYAERLESVGFKVSVVPFAERYSPREREYLGIMENEDIYYCEKITE